MALSNTRRDDLNRFIQRLKDYADQDLETEQLLNQSFPEIHQFLMDITEAKCLLSENLNGQESYSKMIVQLEAQLDQAMNLGKKWKEKIRVLKKAVEH
jgi:hypothetical protein